MATAAARMVGYEAFEDNRVDRSDCIQTTAERPDVNKSLPAHPQDQSACGPALSRPRHPAALTDSVANLSRPWRLCCSETLRPAAGCDSVASRLAALRGVIRVVGQAGGVGCAEPGNPLRVSIPE
eukprot:gene1585-biopygen3049